ncbi:Phage tail fibers [Escherichia phage T4_ev151]|nr:Phage tail fibers [Escherichia phage T4_ev151]
MKLTTEQKVAIREILKTKLSMGVSNVVFEKSDGTIRIMKGTRDADFMPTMQTGKLTESTRKESTDMIPVFDVELGAWRGFSIDKLISVNGMKVEHLLQIIGK